MDDRKIFSFLKPAAELGMIPIWRDRENTSAPKNIPFRINSLSELPGLVEKIFLGG